MHRNIRLYLISRVKVNGRVAKKLTEVSFLLLPFPAKSIFFILKDTNTLHSSLVEIKIHNRF